MPKGRDITKPGDTKADHPVTGPDVPDGRGPGQNVLDARVTGDPTAPGVERNANPVPEELEPDIAGRFAKERRERRPDSTIATAHSMGAPEEPSEPSEATSGGTPSGGVAGGASPTPASGEVRDEKGRR